MAILLQHFPSDILREILLKVIEDRDSEQRIQNLKFIVSLERLNKRFRTIIKDFWIYLYKRDIKNKYEPTSKQYITTIQKVDYYEDQRIRLIACCRNGCNGLIPGLIKKLEMGTKLKALNTAIEFGHLDTMELLLSLGIPLSPNCLSVAITKDNLIIFRYLLDKGAIMSNSANKEILLCCGKGSIKILEFLLDEDREVQLIPRNFDRYLHEAMAGTKNKEIIRLLISKGADKNIIPKHKRKELLEKKCGHPTGTGQPCQRKTCNTYCFQHTK